jgi:formylglycine-generating enzyme required for sulfatase activity
MKLGRLGLCLTLLAALVISGCLPAVKMAVGAPCEPAPALAEPGKPLTGMVRIPAGAFVMGAGGVHPEEGPPVKVKLASFWIDRTEVTNAAFARFVAATGYKTLAERPLDPARYPNLDPKDRRPASLVFVGQTESGNRSNPLSWWQIVPGADWRHPQGPRSSIKGMDQWPAVHIAYEDALAYAHWLGRDLPTEAQWEYAARGGLEAKRYSWGDQPQKPGKPMANSWQGVFPMIDTGEDGYKARTASVGCFAANGYGLRDMAGNVWEWTKDWYKPGLSVNPAAGGPSPDSAYDPADPAVPKHVVKGGSYLCSDDYCFRYRPAARSPGPVDSGASHTGFRTVLVDPSPKSQALRTIR